jgi:hypothetical protein
MSSTIQTDLNVDPYYDDFDETKQFVRILFRPARAVQARELTQFQTILQNQIQRFGNYVFKDGAVVDGIGITYHRTMDYVRVEDSFDTNTAYGVTSVQTNYVFYANTGVRAELILAKPGFVTNYPDTNRFYLRYITTGTSANVDVDTFQSNETLYLYDENQDKLGTLDANNLIDTIQTMTANATANTIGQGYGLGVADGIIYHKGFFLKVDPQTITISDYDLNPNNYVVGFDTTETLVTEASDTSLYDNSNGSPNVNAPGAHRLKLSPVLTAKLRSDTANNQNFFAIVEFEDNNRATEENTGEEGLNILRDVMALRTDEESGDYVVKQFAVETIVDSANSDLFYYQVSPGIGYVDGYRVEFKASKKVSAPRATVEKEAQAQIITANYGNYVLADEVAGAFDIDNIDEVTLYDTAQDTLTDVSLEDKESAPSGNVVGYAQIRGFEYNSGIKGLANAQYRAYLFNIRMSNTFSFSTDVKSMHANSGLGQCKADMVLESNVAVIKDATKNSLVFPVGINAVKRLRDSGGVNDTQFIFRDIKTETLNANGLVTVTLNTPAAGGTERLNYSAGVISDTAELEFNMVLTEGTYTANLTGSVDLTNANGVLIDGTSTTFDDDFIAGDNIRISNGTSFFIRRIVSVTSNVEIVVDSDISDGNTAANFQKYYPDGHIVDISGANGSIDVLSNTQFTVDTNLGLGGDLDSGTQSVHVTYPVLRTAATQIAKNSRENRFVKIDVDSHTSGLVGPWSLGHVDVLKIRNIYVGTTYANTNPEQSNWFILDNGQRESYYDHAKLYVRPEFASNIVANTKFLIEFDHLIANTTAGIGFFSVDSYPIDNANTANSTAIQTADIPLFHSSVYGTTIDLRDAVDFRPWKANTANSATTIANASENPANSATGFSVPGSGQFIAMPDSNFQADLEYYLPRVDLIVFNKRGDLVVRQGQPEETPRTPFNDLDTSVIAKAYVPPFPSLTTREAAAFNRPDIASEITLKSNRRYTMRDIGVLDQRILRMEYYTTLNILEQSARDLVIYDEAGLDRFKNGIFGDAFVNHKLGKVSDFEYKIAIDPQNKVARPLFEEHDVDFKYDAGSSSGVQRTNRYITLPYTHTPYVQQRFATKFRNCTELFWEWNGVVDLYPTYDHFKDVNGVPAINITADVSEPLTSFFDQTLRGTRFGNWRTISSRRDDEDDDRIERAGSRGATTTTTAERTTAQTTVETIGRNIVTTQNFGDFVTDVTLNPFMRSRVVAFIATNLKPNTTLHVHFDDENVDASCAPGVESGISFSDVVVGRENEIVTRNGDFGDALVSDANGKLVGVFRIPDGQFRVGERILRINNVTDLLTGTDAILTEASATYVASSLAITSEAQQLVTRTPVPRQPRTTSSSRDDDDDNDRGDRGNEGNDEPIAQSFLISVPDRSSGMFITKAGLYFNKKDPNLGVTVYLLEMDANFPDSSKIVGKSYLTSASVNVSATAATETQFSFDHPTFLANGKEYALMVHPDANSPEYEIWMAQIGQSDVVTDEQVFSSPYSGTVFISGNARTWTAVQDEDMKFNIYRASFTVGSGTAVLNNEDDEYLTVDGFTKANSSFNIEAGDVVYTQNSSGDLQLANTDPVGYIQFIDVANNELHLDASINGGFATNTVIEIHRPSEDGNTAAISNTSLIANATISTINDLDYHAVVPRFATMIPARTSLTFDFKGTNNTYTTDSAYRSVIAEIEKEFFDWPRAAISKSNEVDNMASAKSSFYRGNLSTASEYVSPVIDLTRKSGLFIENKINNDVTNEDTRYGNALSRYLSRNIVLRDGQEAEDLKVYIGAYRPVNTDIKVYVKIHNQEDNEGFDDKAWTLMDVSSGSALYSATLDIEDFREYEYEFPTTAPVATAGFKNAANQNIVEYSTVSGSRFVGFKTFSIKIVLLSSNPVLVPRLNDLRAIALQV